MFTLLAWILLAAAEPGNAAPGAAKAAQNKGAAATANPDANAPGDKGAPAEGKAAGGGAPDAEKGEKAADAVPKAEGDPDDDAASKGATPWYIDMLNTGLMGYMIKGGIFMWPILVLGILAIGVIIERYRTLRMLNTDTTALRNNVRELLQEDRVEEAFELCDREKGPVAAILSAGLRKFLVLRRLNYDPGRIEEQVVKGMDDYGVHIVGALERHLPILATVSSVGPMIGFLGTVQGMVISFQDIVDTMGERNIVEAAAEGIQVSLLTTVLGLIVGIPAFCAFNYFTSVINRFVLDVEESATELIEAVTLQMTLLQQDQEKAKAEAEKEAATL